MVTFPLAVWSVARPVNETSALPSSTHPRLRPVDAQWVKVHGEPQLWLRDPLALSGATLLVPAPVVPLLARLDGTRDLGSLARELAALAGVPLSLATMKGFVQALDDALLLEGERQRAALEEARAAFRAQPFRPPALAGQTYPAAPESLEAQLTRFGQVWRSEITSAHLDGGALPPAQLTPTLPAFAPMRPIARAAGVLSPHIDYARGGPLYAGTWTAALPAVATAEVVVIFGTDHAGSAGRLTPTRQRYATPWGPLPTDLDAVDALAAAVGETAAYDEELHHRREHSIELATVWLHWALRHSGRLEERLPRLIPILCGSFHPYVQRPTQPRMAPAESRALESPLLEGAPCLEGALTALQQAIGRRRALIVSAADLAHVGPAFGDRAPLGEGARGRLAGSDSLVLQATLSGRAETFLDALRAIEDRTRVCGLPPTYWALRLLERLAGAPLAGRLVGYRQCPADAAFGSVVSIAGVVWE